MPPKEITEHGQVPPLFPVACRISQTGLQNGNLIVHEVQVQETPLLYIGKLVKLCKIPVLGQIQMLLDVSPVQILVLHLSEYLAVRQEGAQILHCIRYVSRAAISRNCSSFIRQRSIAFTLVAMPL